MVHVTGMAGVLKVAAALPDTIERAGNAFWITRELDRRSICEHFPLA